MLSKRADVAFVRETQIRRNEDYGDYAERLRKKQGSEEDVGPTKLDLENFDISAISDDDPELEKTQNEEK